MRSFLLFLGVIALFSFSKAPERIAWSDSLPLHWKDFKGSPLSTDTYAASSATGLSQGYELDGNGVLNKEGTSVVAHFYPEFSWYKVKDTSLFLLRHERAHFDITEIHARKLRKRINEFAFTENSKEEITALYNQVEKERQVMQKQFDQETNHSRNKVQEEVWEKLIAKMLESYWMYTAN